MTGRQGRQPEVGPVEPEGVMRLLLTIQAPEQVIAAANAGECPWQARPCHIQRLAVSSSLSTAMGLLGDHRGLSSLACWGTGT